MDFRFFGDEGFYINFKHIQMKQFFEFKHTSRKIEFAHFYNRSIGIVESYEPDTLKLSTAFGKAKESLILAEELRIRSTKIPLTSEQMELLQKLDNAVSVLMRYSGIKNKQVLPASSESKKLHTFFKDYLSGYSEKNLYQKTGTIELMLAVFEGDALLKQAAANEELTEVMAKITEEFRALDEVYKSRRKSISDKQNLRTREIKRTLYYTLRELFTSIEMAQLTNADINYTMLINEVNQEIIRFNSGSKPRTRPADEATSESEGTEEEKPTEGEEKPTEVI